MQLSASPTSTSPVGTTANQSSKIAVEESVEGREDDHGNLHGSLLGLQHAIFSAVNNNRDLFFFFFSFLCIYYAIRHIEYTNAISRKTGSPCKSRLIFLILLLVS